MRCKAEPIAQRSGKRSRSRRGANQRERATSSGIEVALGPAHHDVDPKSSIARYSISSAGRGDAMDLVDEQHVALNQIGQHRGQIAGPFQGRPEVTPAKAPVRRR